MDRYPEMFHELRRLQSYLCRADKNDSVDSSQEYDNLESALEKLESLKKLISNRTNFLSAVIQMNIPDELFDDRCYDLAEDFLPDDTSEKLKNKLAYCIQVAIEDWLEAAGIESK